MFRKGECFEFQNFVIEVIGTYKSPTDENMYKVEYYTNKGKDYRKEGFISETLLECLPTFPF